jgi:hypothetical protein
MGFFEHILAVRVMTFEAEQFLIGKHGCSM